MSKTIAIVLLGCLVLTLPACLFGRSSKTKFSGKYVSEQKMEQLKAGASRSEVLELLRDPANLRYQPDPRGLLAAREALAQDYRRRGTRAAGEQSDLARMSPNDLFLCASTSEAYSWLLKLLCDPGDAVLVPKPGYPLVDHLARLETVEARAYRLEYVHPSGWTIDIESIDAAMRDARARALVLINPNNPTGSYVTGRERDVLIELCRRHDCALIVDEVFFHFPVEGSAEELHEGEWASFAGEERVLCFVLDGLSKRLGMPQMKLGWIAASGPEGELREAQARLEIIADTYLSVGTPSMNALPALLPMAEDFTRHCRRRLATNIGELREILEDESSPHRVLACRGGWTAIIESPRLRSEEELALGLLSEDGLATQPGYFFDMEREAFFTASLILEPHELARGARAYAAYFDRLLQT